MQISIVGNGSIGSLAAIELARKYPNSDIVLFGKRDRPWAASTAAGAMANVYAEIEESSGYINETNLKYLEMGIYGSHAWRKFLDDTNGLNSITSPDTYVYLKKNSSNFEAANFNAVCHAAKGDGVLKQLSRLDISELFPSHASTSVNEAIKIKGEFTFSTFNLFLHLDSMMEKLNVRIVDANIEQIDLTHNEIIVNSASNEKYSFDRLILCAGARTSTLLPQDSIMPVLQGVGVALLLDEVKDIEMQKLRKGVFRTVNRGGAQCGMHIVPREDGKFYLGAGNYVSKAEDPKIRFDTIRYLLETLGDDLIGKNLRYELTGATKLGLRPRALDGFPIIGPLEIKHDVFVATATNRAGLTWAPFIVRQMENWLDGQPLNKLVSDWKPNRSPISFGSLEYGINYFTESRISNAIEHGLISQDSKEVEKKRKEFTSVATTLAREVNSRLNLDSNMCVNPDNWSAICSLH